MPGERDEPDGVVVEAFPDLIQLRFPPDESGRLIRNPVLLAGGRHERRKALREVRVGELEDALGPSQALELVLAQVAQR
jgi:hypothetical protein